jgi:peroxiredoxin Q/BCP
VTYFMVSVDTPEDNKAFAEKEHADFPMLSDPSRKVAQAYGVLRAPSAAQPNAPSFAQRWSFYIGPDGKILLIEKGGGATQTASAGATLLAHLKELGVPEKK